MKILCYSFNILKSQIYEDRLSPPKSFRLKPFKTLNPNIPLEYEDIRVLSLGEQLPI